MIGLKIVASLKKRPSISRFLLSSSQSRDLSRRSTLLFSLESLGSRSHWAMLAINPSISLKVLFACRHTRTLSPPTGIVGGTTGLIMKPASWQCFARLRGLGVKMGMIADFGSSRENLMDRMLRSSVSVATCNESSWSWTYLVRDRNWVFSYLIL